MGVLIDTNILIGWEKGRLDLTAQLQTRGEEYVFISVITVSEMLHGVHRAIDPAIAQRRSEIVERLIAQFPALEIDVDIARQHARLWAELEVAGTPISAHDMWIAATGLRYALTVVTGNVREFQRVAGLTVENWLVP